MTILQETVGANSIPAGSLDLAISLGVLHHIPDTGLAIKTLRQRSRVAGFSFAICITSSKTNRFSTVGYFGLQTRYVG